jgi:hypothetical protein
LACKRKINGNAGATKRKTHENDEKKEAQNESLIDITIVRKMSK